MNKLEEILNKLEKHIGLANTKTPQGLVTSPSFGLAKSLTEDDPRVTQDDPRMTQDDPMVTQEYPKVAQCDPKVTPG